MEHLAADLVGGPRLNGNALRGLEVRQDPFDAPGLQRTELLGRDLDAIARRQHLGQGREDQGAPGDDPVPNLGRLDAHAKGLLDLEAHVQKVDGLRTQIPHQGGRGHHLRFLHPKRLHEDLPERGPHLVPAPLPLPLLHLCHLRPHDPPPNCFPSGRACLP